MIIVGDFTQDLEIELKNSCDRFISHATDDVGAPLLQFVRQLEAFQASVASTVEPAGDGDDGERCVCWVRLCRRCVQQSAASNDGV